VPRIGAAEPAYQRLDVDERRRQLLEIGQQLFTQHAYSELSMADIARAAGISKALLYHYFPSKRDFFQATLTSAAAEVAQLTQPDPSLTPLEQIRRILDAYLAWIEGHAEAYTKLLQSATSHPEVSALIEQIRDATSDRITAGLVGGQATSIQRAAVRAWLWFIDGACSDWLQRRDYTREQLRELLMRTLQAAIAEDAPS
jgi:AcrR family transcriptional regulator